MLAQALPCQMYVALHLPQVACGHAVNYLSMCPAHQPYSEHCRLDFHCNETFQDALCALQQRRISVCARLQELSEVHIALPAPLVCHEQASGLGEHEGMDGAHMVHGSQASRLL